MSASRTKFYLDKKNRKFMGVCAGISEYTGIDVTWVRVSAVLLTLFVFQPLVLVYLVVGWVAKPEPRDLYEDAEDAKFWQGVRQSPARSTRDVRSKFRDIDRRLAEVEMYYTSRNRRLADEIDALR